MNDAEGHAKGRQPTWFKTWLLAGIVSVFTMLGPKILGWWHDGNEASASRLNALEVKAAVHDAVITRVETNFEEFRKQLNRMERTLGELKK